MSLRELERVAMRPRLFLKLLDSDKIPLLAPVASSRTAIRPPDVLMPSDTVFRDKDIHTWSSYSFSQRQARDADSLDLLVSTRRHARKSVHDVDFGRSDEHR